MTEDLDIMAFPTAVPQDWAMMQDGMSLRDWFAGQALAGIMAHRNLPPLHGVYDQNIVHRAYDIAQDMLVERKKYV
jgi:hypothetical protein